MANFKQIKATGFLLTTALIWGFAFVAQCGVTQVDPFLLLGVRYVVGGISLFPLIFLYENRMEKRAEHRPAFRTNLKAGLVCGTVLFTASLLQQLGINMNPNAGKAGFITGTYTVLVPVFYLIFFKRKTNANVWVGVACAVTGLYLLSVTNGLGSIMLADVIVFAGAVFWSFHIIVIDKYINDVSPLKFSSMQFIVCGLLGLIIALIRGNLTFSLAVSQITDAWFPLLYMAVCSSGVAYTCQALGQRDADPTSCALILSLESVFAAVGGVLFGVDSDMTLRKYFGCGIIFVGIIISQIKFSKEDNKYV